MDVTKLLEADHRQVEDLFRRIEAAEGDERAPLIDELRESLLAHMQLEEDVFYPKVRSIVGSESVQEANTEHDLARKDLQSMLELAPDVPGFGAALAAAQAGIQHHVDEEEAEYFPAVRENADVLQALATPFMQRRVELGMATDGEALAAASSKQELLDEATSAGIETNSSMTKKELADALGARLSQS